MDYYIDGACSGNPGPGGWAVIKVDNGVKVGQMSGHESQTTNNRMEITAFIAAINDAAPKDHIYTDSMYVVNCYNNFEKWLLKKNIPNPDLVSKAIEGIIQNREVALHKVLGHSDNKFNEEADKLAVLETRKL